MKVLVGVDGSSNSFAAVEFVGRLISPERDELVLIYAAPDSAISADEGLEQAILDRARGALNEAVYMEAMSRLSSSWQSRVEQAGSTGVGRPAAALLEAIDQHKADMIAVGFRGTSGILEEFMLGSVSRAVVHSAPVPVLVVKSGAPTDEVEKQSSGPIERKMHVLVAYQGPRFAEEIAQHLKRFTWPEHTRAWLMTVLRPLFLTDLPDWIKLKRDPDVEAMANAWQKEHHLSLEAARSELERFRATLPPCFTREEVIVAEGRPAEQILAQVRGKEIDLVVVGSHGQAPVRRMLLGSTSEQVLREASCSVLIVR